MPTSIPLMDDFTAAGIIDQEFPRHPLFWKRNPDMQTHMLTEALYVARTRSASNTIEDNIEWARKVLREHN